MHFLRFLFLLQGIFPYKCLTIKKKKKEKNTRAFLR